MAKTKSPIREAGDRMVVFGYLGFKRERKGFTFLNGVREKDRKGAWL